ncbi:ComEC/Rec2 family competence protein [Joostella sp. CR20]|uniref:ComEC/Rec2 family competence protein n=1 Tax=Joostella sp. CR20 TaxID=2804312 RepID=UPI00313B25E2
MKLLNYPILKLLICFIAGILFGYFFQFKTVYLVSATILCIALLFYFKVRKSNTLAFGICTYLTFVVIGALNIAIHSERNPKHYQYSYQAKDTITFKISKELKQNTHQYLYEAEVLKTNSKSVNGKILVVFNKDSLQTPKIDYVYTTQNLQKPINKPLNPYEFDYSRYLSHREIYHQLQLKKTDVQLISTEVKSIFGFASLFRERINESLSTYPNKEEIAVVNALLLGQRQDVSKETYNAYAMAGAIHLLAISGLHIGILFLFLHLLLKPIERIKHGKKIKLLLIVITLWAFATIAGLSASVVRAVTMFSFLAYAKTLNRQRNSYYALISSMLVLLLFEPNFLFDVGFQLSYAAVFGILWIQPTLVALWTPNYKITSYLWSLFTVSLAAQLSVLPITLYYFHQFPGLFFVSNLVLIPFIGILLGAGFILIILAFFNILPTIYAEVYLTCIHYMNVFTAWIAQKEAFIFTTIHFTALNFISTSILIVLTILLLKKRSKNISYIFFGIILFCFGTIFFQYKKTENKQRFIVFHQNRKTLIGIQKGRLLQVNDTASEENYILKNYKTGANINQLERIKFSNPINFQQQKIVFIDSTLAYKKEDSLSILLLINSPKINLEKVLLELKPTKVIADGSNYKSLVQLWKRSCTQQKIPFHYTGEKGAFVLTN